MYIKGTDQLRAWISYQTALDYLAMHRLGLQADGDKAHQAGLQKAMELDKNKCVWPLYSDQLAILEDMLPAKTHDPKAATP